MMNFRALLAATALTLSFASCSKKETEEVTPQPTGTSSLDLKINTTFNTTPLALNSPYTTSGGENVSFDQWRYWVSNVELTAKDGSTYKVPNSYYLMQELSASEAVQGFTLPAGKRDAVNIPYLPAGEYTGIRFSLGVDQRYNDNLSLAAGELSVMQNMSNVSWMWNTSYVFTKLKGTVTPASGGARAFAIETGTNANYRTVTLTFPAPISIGADYQPKVEVKADVAKMLGTIVITRDAQATTTGGVTSYAINGTTGAMMTTVSNNYAQAFSLNSATSK